MKGLFTQGVAVLFSESPSLAQLRALLDDYEIISENPLGTSQWQMESASFRIACLPEVNGVCLMDIVSRSWPDHLGNSEREPALHAAWALGHFGPFAATGSLARAIEHAHRWEHAAQLAPQHSSFVRMRISYSLGSANEGTPLLPPDYDPLPELEWLIALARHVTRHPRAVAYFNPNGEVLLAPDGLQKVLDDAAHSEAPPLDAMINVRLAHLEGWQLVDTIGLAQLDFLDQEIVCPDQVSSSEELSAFLYDAAYHMVTTETPIVTDNSSVGPGGTEWVAEARVSSLREPARTIMHWTETEGPYEPEHFVMAAVEPYDQAGADAAAANEPYSAFEDPANWEAVPTPDLRAGAEKPPVFQRSLLMDGGRGRRRRSGNGILWLGVLALLSTMVFVAWRKYSSAPAPTATEDRQAGWAEEAAAVLNEWQPNADLDSKAQAPASGGYHTLIGEGRAGSGFIMRYGDSQIFCGVTTLHQFDGRTPASMDGPVGLKVLLDNMNVLRLKDVQVQQVTDVSRPFECLEFDPKFTLRPGDELLVPTGDGDSVTGKMANSLLVVDQFVSVPGRSQELTLKFDKPFDLKGFSGSPVIKVATGKVVGVLRSGDATRKLIGFETLSLGPLPAPPPAPAKP